VSIRLMEQEALPADDSSEESSRPQAAQAESPGAAAPAGSLAADPVARLVFVTHPAYERDVQACLHDLRHLDVVESIGGLLRVIGS
jgi:hypothetical protein